MADRVAAELDRWSQALASTRRDEPRVRAPSDRASRSIARRSRGASRRPVHDAGVTVITFHELRHTFATRMAAPGRAAAQAPGVARARGHQDDPDLHALRAGRARGRDGQRGLWCCEPVLGSVRQQGLIRTLPAGRTTGGLPCSSWQGGPSRRRAGLLPVRLAGLPRRSGSAARRTRSRDARFAWVVSGRTASNLPREPLHGEGCGSGRALRTTASCRGRAPLELLPGANRLRASLPGPSTRQPRASGTVGAALSTGQGWLSVLSQILLRSDTRTGLVQT